MSKQSSTKFVISEVVLTDTDKNTQLSTINKHKQLKTQQINELSQFLPPITTPSQETRRVYSIASRLGDTPTGQQSTGPQKFLHLNCDPNPTQIFVTYSSEFFAQLTVAQSSVDHLTCHPDDFTPLILPIPSTTQGTCTSSIRMIINFYETNN